MNLSDMVVEAERLSKKIDDGIAALYQAGQEMAEAELEYKKCVAKAWIDAPKGTVPQREAYVEAECGEEKFLLDIAESKRQTALEAVRSRRTQMSALQSLMAAYRAEAEFARTGLETL